MSACGAGGGGVCHVGPVGPVLRVDVDAGLIPGDRVVVDLGIGRRRDVDSGPPAVAPQTLPKVFAPLEISTGVLWWTRLFE